MVLLLKLIPLAPPKFETHLEKRSDSYPSVIPFFTSMQSQFQSLIQARGLKKDVKKRNETRQFKTYTKLC